MLVCDCIWFSFLYSQEVHYCFLCTDLNAVYIAGVDLISSSVNHPVLCARNARDPIVYVLAYNNGKKRVIEDCSALN